MDLEEFKHTVLSIDHEARSVAQIISNDKNIKSVAVIRSST